MKNLIVINKSKNPWFNLAFEEYLLNNLMSYEHILFLWQNQNTVVIGKNQNPWRECRTNLLEEEGGKLARRSTGGGAVFHDLGNLNFSFIMPRANQDFKEQAEIIIEAAAKFNIEAFVNGRNDIVTNGGKFSGNAFAFKKERALHHGTVLIDVDKEKLGRYLQVSKEKMQAKGVKSVQSRVVNLKEYKQDLSVEDFKKALVEAFVDRLGPANIIDEDKEDLYASHNLDKQEIDKLYELYSSWDFRYGQAPTFDLEWINRFPWGGVEIHLTFKNGIIITSKIYSDALDLQFVKDLEESFDQVPFKKEAILKALDEKLPSSSMKKDIMEFIESKEI